VLEEVVVQQIAVIAGRIGHIRGAVHDRRIPRRGLEHEVGPALLHGTIAIPSAHGRIKPAAVVVAVDHQRRADLLEVALALHALGLFPGGLKRRQKQRDQDGDDADDDQQLDQRESAPGGWRRFRRMHNGLEVM
jgi:hypothetical protein